MPPPEREKVSLVLGSCGGWKGGGVWNRRTWVFPLHAVWVEELGAVVGLAVDEAVGVFYGAGGVEVISSPSWICDDDVR
jgi:hypothetical protein